jgi:hypothetical protein
MTTLCRIALVAAVLGTCGVATTRAQTTVYDQPPTGGSTVVKSAVVPPDGVDGNEMVWDAFSVGTDRAITSIRWRGGYTNVLYGAGMSPVLDFDVSIHASTAGGSQPDIVAPPLVHYTVGGNAGETFVGTFGGVPMYDYQSDLPSSFMAVGGVRYWAHIVAQQMPSPAPYYWPPDWGFSAATGGDGSHFRAILGGTGGGGTLYQTVTGDAAFRLLAASGATYTIVASESPAGSGTILGAGPYTAGTIASLTATPNPGFGFVDWAEGGIPVSASATYTFTVTASRTLVAEFAPAFTVTTSPAPIYGGTTTGGGTYVQGSPVTVVATPDPGFVFVDWTEFGTPVSTAASYGFIAGADRALVAEFTAGTASARFDFDTGTPALGTGQGLAFSQVAAGITAYFSSPQGSAFSVQTDASTGWHMALFSGHYLYDNNLNRNVLDVTFDHLLEGIYLTFATADFNQAEVPTTLQLTAYLASTAGTPVGTATAHGAYIGSTMPMGTLSFHPGVPFNIVELVLPPQPLGSTDFFVDDIMVAVSAVGEVSGMALTGLPLALAPNPARDGMDIAFELPAESPARVGVFDLAGRCVREVAAGTFPPGRHVRHWDGRDGAGARVSAGVYFVRLEAAGRVETRKALLLR